MKEQAIQKKIIKHIESEGGYVVKVISASKSGVPDLLACIPMGIDEIAFLLSQNDKVGVFVGIEVKTPQTKNNVSELQKYNLAKIKRCGGLSCVAWSVEQLEDILL